MKKVLVLIIALTILIALAACGSESGSNIDQISPLEKYFPADWAGRYVLIETEGESVDVFCKSAYDNDVNEGWLFSVTSVNIESDELTAVTELGSYEGQVIYASYPSNVYEFDNETVAEDYNDMAYDVEEILHQLLHAIGGEHDHSLEESANTEESSTGTYVTPEAIGITNTYVGVFHLDTSRWSDESISELLNGNDQNSYLSIAPDGTAYLRCGDKVTEGTAVIYSALDHTPEDKSLYMLTFDGVTYEANLFQSYLTIDEMPEYTDLFDMQGTSWTFIHESDDWWTENDIN